MTQLAPNRPASFMNSDWSFTLSMPGHYLAYFLGRNGRMRLATGVFYFTWGVGVIGGAYVSEGAEAFMPLAYISVPLLISSYILSPKQLLLYYASFALAAVIILPSSNFQYVISALSLGGIISILLATAASMRESREKLLLEERARSVHAGRLSQMGELTAGIAHEINSPLTVILGHAERIGFSESLSEKAKRGTESIVQNCRRIHKIVGGLRRFSRDVSGEIFVNIDVAELVEQVKQLCMSRFRKAGIKFQVVFPEGSCAVHGRAIEIEQVLVNLINNAIDASEGTAQANVLLKISEQEGYIRFSVYDSGPGLDPRQGKQVFTPFYTTKGDQGTGLGLSISRQIVEDHSGKIWFDPDYRNGGCFIFQIPKAIL